MQIHFTTAAKEARAKGSYDLARRIETEGRICRRLITHALAAGYCISVNDGEDWVVKKSRNIVEIIGAMSSTDSDVLTFRDPTDKSTNNVGRKVGSVVLIYGNGNDVISDYSAPTNEALEAFSEWLKPVENYAETL